MHTVPNQLRAARLLLVAIAAGLVASLALPPVQADDGAAANGGADATWEARVAKAREDAADLVAPPVLHRTTLDNGLEIIVAPRTRVPTVATYLFYDVGSADERAGETGYAHYLEHLMFKGTADYAAGEIDLITTRAGGENNAWTSTDNTAYHFLFPKATWTTALDIEASRMRSLTLDPTEFDAEREVVLTEEAMNAEDPWGDLVDRGIAAAFPTHAYGHTILGAREDVEAATTTTIRAFYDRYYRPNNATLVIVGDVDPPQAVAAVRERFGSLPRGERVVRSEPLPTDGALPWTHGNDDAGDARLRDFGTTLSLEVESDRARLLLLHNTTPPGNRADTAALAVLDALLAVDDHARLPRGLIDETGLVDAVGAWTDPMRLGGYHAIWAEHDPSISPLTVCNAIDATIAAIAERGVTERELTKARNTLVASSIFGTAANDALAQAIGASVALYGDPLTHWDTLADVLAVVDADVQRVARRYFVPARRMLAVSLPSGTTLTDYALDIDNVTIAGFDGAQATLRNGLEVIALRADDTPTASLSLDLIEGSLAQPVEQQGAARLMGALLEMGTRRRSGAEIADAIGTVGGSLSASANGISATVLSRDVSIALELMADIARAANYPPESVELKRSQVLAAIAAERDDPATVVSERLRRVLYGAEHPYGFVDDVGVIGALTRNDLLALHAAIFRPDHARLIIVGATDPVATLRLVDRHFGAWTGSAAVDPPTVELPGLPRQTADVEVAIPDPDLELCTLRLAHAGVARSHPDFVALQVMDQILGYSAQFSDRLSRDIRDTKGLVYTIYSSMTVTAREGQGYFLAHAATELDNVVDVVHGVLHHMQRLQREPVSEQELTDAKAALAGALPFRFETNTGVASFALSLRRYGLPDDYADAWRAAVNAVTIKDVQRVAQEQLAPEAVTLVITGPFESNATDFLSRARARLAGD